MAAFGIVSAMMLVISPHLDDAVLSCGCPLADHPGSIVVTVFAGAPRDPDQRTDWDARCGFASAGQAVAVRRQEDRAALAQLRATPVWLDFCDSQYGETPAVEAVGDALERLIGELRPVQVLFPLGLYHSDHLLVHAASRPALRALRHADALAYEDVPYRGLPGLLQRRLAELEAVHVRATPARVDTGPGSPARKAQALRAYASQWRAFGEQGLDDAAQPERCWRLDEEAAAREAR
jgi:LmbE family N-acetylglucosaminyl deacetylase